MDDGHGEEDGGSMRADALESTSNLAIFREGKMLHEHALRLTSNFSTTSRSGPVEVEQILSTWIESTVRHHTVK